MPADDSAKIPLTGIRVVSTADAPAEGKRRWLAVGGVAALAAAATAIAYFATASAAHVTTSNANVQAPTALVTALVSGVVVEAPVVETQAVKAGQVLAVVDPADFRFAAARAQADVDAAVRHARQLAGDVSVATDDLEIRRAAVARAEAELDRARVVARRRGDLARDGAVSGDDLTEAQANLAKAEAAVTQARAEAAFADDRRTIARALAPDAAPESHPDVVAARARLDQARTDLSRTVVRAPIDGVVTRKSVEVGQRVASGTPLMAVVPVSAVYVDANFKEAQLRRVQVGQPVRLVSDLYGSKVVFHGRVAGLSGGTGSAFAIIPAQNATGNWIKVVQRLPVRIALDPRELKDHPLRVGLSMTATVDLKDR